MGDADFADVPVNGLLEQAYLQNRSALISLQTALSEVAAGVPNGVTKPGVFHAQHESIHTTHFSIVDSDGNMVACTSTIEETWGNGVVVPGRGFLLNNELSDFSEGATGANAAEGGKKRRRTALPPLDTTFGGKRPRSSMTPTIVLKEGKPWMAIGSPGGWRIICSVISALFNVLEFGMSLQEAVDFPRMATRNEGDWFVEKALMDDVELIAELQSRGFDNFVQRSQGAVSIVTVDSSGNISAVADPRSQGFAITL
eukprot:TRINITY_DN16355_c0_g1_i1.p1 TRINITY_DN16355_c0_g1~~TRINITY_DN16355_c0_g1_i1.p1  ORF type:complete len:296 (-),score=49.53 TRINITY_DN16355_c0_g1_i1:158-925(-)